MLEFLRRIPELLRLGRKPKPQSPPRLRVVGTSEGAAPANQMRVRGSGRGITPPSHPTPKKRRGGKR